MKTKKHFLLNLLALSLSTATSSLLAVGIGDLITAAKNGDIPDMHQLIDQGIDINGQNGYGNTPLYWAARNGNIQVIEALIHRGANPDAPIEYGVTPLHTAINYQHIEAVKALINNKANVNASDDSGDTPLHWAARRENLEIIGMLIAQGANVNTQNNSGDAPLHWASGKSGCCYNGINVRVIETLIKRGAQVNARNNKGDTPLHCIATINDVNGITKSIHALIRLGADMHMQNQLGNTPLHEATCLDLFSNSGARRVEALKALISLHADLEAKNNKGWTALHNAIAQSHLEGIKILVNTGASLRAPQGEVGTVLSWAIKNKYTQALPILVELGVEQDVQDNPIATANSHNNVPTDDLVPLIQAAHAGDEGQVKLLLSQGANIHTMDAKGRTALHHAIVQGHIGIATYLIDQGADLGTLDFTDIPFLSNLLINSESDLLELIQKILSAQANDDTPQALNQVFLHAVAQRGNIQTVKFVLDRFKLTPKQLPLALAFQDVQGQTALHKAATNPDISVMRILLAAYKSYSRKSLNALDQHGESALHKAVRASNQESIHLYDDYLLDFDQKNYAQQTLLHIAARHASLKIVKLLLGDSKNPIQQHIDTQAVDKDGQTVLHLALHNPNTAVFEYLAQNQQSLLHIPDNAGETVLHHAARIGNIRLIELCNEYQLDFTTRNQAGQTPLQIAQAANQPAKVIQAIQQAMQYNNIQQPSATPRPSVQEVKLWSACELGQAHQQELNTVQNQTNRNQTTQAIISDDDDESSGYFFGQQALPDQQNPNQTDDDTDTPDAHFLLTPNLYSI